MPASYPSECTSVDYPRLLRRNRNFYPFIHAAFDLISAVFLIKVGLVSMIVLSTKRERILDRGLSAVGDLFCAFTAEILLFTHG